EIPEATKRAVVSELLENGGRLFRERDKGISRTLRRAEEPEESQLQPGAHFSPSILLGDSCLDRVLECLLDTIELATTPEDDPELDQEVAPDNLLSRQKRDGAGQEVGGCRRVAALDRTETGRREVVTGLGRERSCAPAVGSELGEITMRLFQMEANQLVGPSALRLRPESKALVQLGLLRLRERRVGRVADQDMAKDVTRLASVFAAAFADQAFAHQSREVSIGSFSAGQELEEGID